MQISWRIRHQPTLKYSFQSDRQIQCFARTFRQLKSFLWISWSACAPPGPGNGMQQVWQESGHMIEVPTYFWWISHPETWQWAFGADLMLNVALEMLLRLCTAFAWHATSLDQSRWINLSCFSEHCWSDRSQKVPETEVWRFPRKPLKQKMRRRRRRRATGQGWVCELIVQEPAGKPICAQASPRTLKQI